MVILLEFSWIAGEYNDIWVIKVDFSGDIIWSKCYGGSKSEGSSWIQKMKMDTFTIFGQQNPIIAMYRQYQ